MADKIRHYTDQEIDVSYEMRRCIHERECTRGVPSVFDHDHYVLRARLANALRLEYPQAAA